MVQARLTCGWRPAVALATRTGLYTLTWAAVAVYVLWAFFAAVGSLTWEEDTLWESMRNMVKVGYAMLPDQQLLSNWDAQMMFFHGLCICIAATAVTAALYLRPARVVHDKSTADGAVRWIGMWESVKRGCAWQVPPRGFWLKWCDGMTALEACLVLGWIIGHCWTAHDLVVYFEKKHHAFDRVGLFYNAPKVVYKLEFIGLAWAWLIWTDVVMLFLPIAHNSFLNRLFGQHYSALVRYHRWIGHSTLITTSLHGIFYYLLWICNPEQNFWEEVFDWSTLSSVNFFAGTIAWAFAIAMWVTAIEYVRRHNFEVFYRLHIVGFVGFMVFSMIHFYPNFSVFVPALLLYFADIAMRVVQAQNVTSATLVGRGAKAAGAVTEGEVAVLHVPVSKDVGLQAGQDVYVLVPSISRWQWHPFTVGDVMTSGDCITVAATKAADVTMPAATSDFEAVAALYVKALGPWTMELMRQAYTYGSLPIRMIGPFGGVDVAHYTSYSHVLVMAGGIGVAPVLVLLRDMLALHRTSSEVLPNRVTLVWAARHPEEFLILDEAIASAATNGSGWLSIKLYCTQQRNSTTKPVNGGSSATPSGCPIPLLVDQSVATGVTVVRAARSSSGFLWSLIRPMQPQVLGGVMHSDLFRLVVLLVTALGGFMGTMLAQCAATEWLVSTDYEYYYWRLGLVGSFVIPIYMIGLPVVLVVFPMHAYRLWRLSKADALSPGDVEMLQCRNMMPSLVNDALVYGESGTSIGLLSGRPDIKDILHKAAAEAAGATKEGGTACGRMAVVCAGPASMNMATQEAVTSFNDTAVNKVYLDFYKEAYEL